MCGVADTVGSGHAYYVLTIKGNVICRSSVTHLSADDMHETKEQRRIFDDEIKVLLGDYSKSTIKNQVVDPSCPYKDFLLHIKELNDTKLIIVFKTKKLSAVKRNICHGISCN